MIRPDTIFVFSLPPFPPRLAFLRRQKPRLAKNCLICCSALPAAGLRLKGDREHRSLMRSERVAAGAAGFLHGSTAVRNLNCRDFTKPPRPNRAGNLRFCGGVPLRKRRRIWPDVISLHSARRSFNLFHPLSAQSRFQSASISSSQAWAESVLLKQRARQMSRNRGDPRCCCSRGFNYPSSPPPRAARSCLRSITHSRQLFLVARIQSNF